MSADHDDVTELLQAWNAGDDAAREQVVTLVYQELRRRAVAQMRRERIGHSLQPTALVHEAFLRLDHQHRAVWRNRTQFLAVASRMMRRILVDRARARHMAKRSGQWARVTLDPAAIGHDGYQINLIDLDTALTQLSALDPRKGRIVELRFFGGLTLEETGELLNLSVPTVERDWQLARAWLFKTLSASPSP